MRTQGSTERGLSSRSGRGATTSRPSTDAREPCRASLTPPHQDERTPRSGAPTYLILPPATRGRHPPPDTILNGMPTSPPALVSSSPRFLHLRPTGQLINRSTSGRPPPATRHLGPRQIHPAQESGHKKGRPCGRPLRNSEVGLELAVQRDVDALVLVIVVAATEFSAEVRREAVVEA